MTPCIFAAYTLAACAACTVWAASAVAMNAVGSSARDRELIREQQCLVARERLHGGRLDAGRHARWLA